MTATDANRFVLRFARHLTGRPRIAVMDWCYHGTVDEAFADARRRPGRAATGPARDRRSTSPRPPPCVPFNDVDALDRRLAEGDVACLLMEPALTNIGIVLPDDGYLDAVREITRRHGVLLVIDETHTLCAGPGGATARVGPRPRPAGGRQADRGRRAARGVRHDRGGGGRAARADARPRDRRRRRRRHAHRQRAGDGGGPGRARRRRCARRTSRSRSRWPSASPPASPR